MQLKPVQQAPAQRKRRQTSITAPLRSQLTLQPVPVGIPEGRGHIPLRRSVSDEAVKADKEKIAKILAAKQKQWGTMDLYFGCRRSDMDLIYKEELKKAQVFGALSDVMLALSREPNKPKVSTPASIRMT